MSVQDLSCHVVQVLTLHCIPNFMRPWEVGHDVESSSSAFVVDRARRWVHGRGGASPALPLYSLPLPPPPPHP